MRWWVCKCSIQAILYVINNQNNENCNKKNTEHNDLRIQTLLTKYKKIFQSKLSDELFLKKNFIYNINIDNTKLVN